MENNKGSALLSALFIMTLVAIAVTAMTSRLQLDIYRTRLSITSDKLYLASQAIIFWGMDELSKKIPLTSLDKAGKLLTYNRSNLLRTDYPNFKTTGALYDLQARFNLNNVQNKKYNLVFNQLMRQTTTSKAESQNQIALALSTWIKPYQLNQGKDVFQDVYANQDPPYYSSNMPMVSVSELRLIAGVDAKIFQQLAPFVTVLPEITPININTAPKKVLMALGNGVPPSVVDDIVTARGEEGIEDMQKILPLLEKGGIPDEQITLESQYFLCIARVQGEDFSLVNYSILKRVKSTKEKIKVYLIAQSLNTL